MGKLTQGIVYLNSEMPSKHEHLFSHFTSSGYSQFRKKYRREIKNKNIDSKSESKL